MVFKATKDPNKYAPLSPRNILAFGKLKRRNVTRMIICAVKKNENSICSLFKLINNKAELIIIKFIVRRPLKPSIKLAPFTINKKHKSIKNIEKILFSNHEFKKIRSMLLISIGRKITQIVKQITINISLIFGLVFIFTSSK
tara:strand:+ start:376 stop:801 length:426 start_codon:yes stop_codon:yes gene_type:complete